MGRPIKKIFIGERGAGSGGAADGLASVTLGPTNDSSGYTAADALTIGAPDLAGVQATAEVTVKPTGALTTATTYGTILGTGVDGLGAAAQVFTGVTDLSTSGSGINAVWTITKDNTNGVTDYTDISDITLTTDGSGFILTEIVTIDGADIGGVTTTNDMTFVVGTFVAGTNDCIDTVVVTEAGSGYTVAPTITAPTGSLNTLTLTGVLTAGSLPIIIATAFLDGGANEPADIEAQKGNDTYRVTTTDGTGECTLTSDGVTAHGTPTAAGEMQILAYDSGDGIYSVTKLYNGHVRLQNISGTPEFADDVKVKWAEDGVAVLDYSVSISGNL